MFKFDKCFKRSQKKNVINTASSKYEYDDTHNNINHKLEQNNYYILLVKKIINITHCIKTENQNKQSCKGDEVTKTNKIK